MEPNLIDYYNEMPQMVHIIDNMNQELTEVQKKYEELQKKYKELKDKEKKKLNFQIYFTSIEERNEKHKQMMDNIKRVCDELIEGCMEDILYDYGLNGIEKYLKLYTTQTTTNMHLFNEHEQLRKYNNVYEIVDEYYSIRYRYYNKRKLYLIDLLSKELVTLSNKAKYIQNILDDKIDLRKKNKEQINTILENMSFDKDNGNFNYLIKMPMDSVIEENVEKIMKEHANKLKELEEIKKTTIENIWLKELNNLKVAYNNLYDDKKKLKT